MGFFDFLRRSQPKEVDEAIDAFRGKGTEEKPLTPKQMIAQSGEGVEDIQYIEGYGSIGLTSFNLFYNQYLNKQFETEVQRIWEYRRMSTMAEVADVIEDATNESTQEDDEGKVFNLVIRDSDLEQNENIVNTLEREFKKLFYETLNITNDIWDFIRTYFIDGRVFYERVINTNKKTNGIISLKKLPSETMDYIIDPYTGNITHYFQYLQQRPTKPHTLEEAQKREDVIIFNPEQIGFINYGHYGRNKYEILGYLEKAKVAYNQLKLLETSVIIYRLVRAPERLVFRIDTGNMPKDKAMKFVEKIKQKMVRKQSYDPSTGTLSQEPEIMSMLENFYLPQSADGRGSSVETVGGNPAGFAELDDIYYFARKLYRALKYPMSRVSAGQEKREADIMFGGSQTGEITRDEIKWARFLERQQRRVCDDLTDMFILHLDFKGIKKQYGLTKDKIRIMLNPPSNYKQQMEQNFLETSFNNYTLLADRPEMSKYYLMRKYLHWSDDEIKANVQGFKKDKELGLVQEEGEGGGMF